MDPYNSADTRAAAANPFAAPAARVADTRFAHEQDLTKASRLSRLGAVLLDTAVIFVPAMVLAIALPAMQGGYNGGLSFAASTTLFLAVIGMIAFAIYNLVLLHRHGQTFGKKLVGIRIVRGDGSRAGLRRIFALRYFVPGVIGAIPLIGPFFSLANPLFIFGEGKRCLHDMIADTIVVES